MNTNYETAKAEVIEAGRIHAASGAGLGDVRTFKTGPKSSIRGTVVAVEFGGVKTTKTVVRAIYRLTLECGVNKVLREVTTDRI
jgi:hypothetical protein